MEDLGTKMHGVGDSVEDLGTEMHDVGHGVENGYEDVMWKVLVSLKWKMLAKMMEMLNI